MGVVSRLASRFDPETTAPFITGHHGAGILSRESTIAIPQLGRGLKKTLTFREIYFFFREKGPSLNPLPKTFPIPALSFHTRDPHTHILKKKKKKALVCSYELFSKGEKLSPEKTKSRKRLPARHLARYDALDIRKKASGLRRLTGRRGTREMKDQKSRRPFRLKAMMMVWRGGRLSVQRVLMRKCSF